MKKVALSLVVAFSTLMMLGTDARAQWTKVLQLQNTFASSAYFFNATEGLIGTGSSYFKSNTVASIYYTKDGGATWRESQLPNPNVIGQVTDIYFRDRQHGWATIAESYTKGFGGVYRTTDGGVTWRFVVPAAFAAGIRETKRGVFYTDRTGGTTGSGRISFSSDDGNTWQTVGSTIAPLGIEFIDDATGMVTTLGNSGQHLMTTDSGKTWNALVDASEAWSVFGDPVLRSFFVTSEHWHLGNNIETSVFKTPIINPTETPLKTYQDSGLTGGVNGAHSCKSVVYIQGWSAASNGPRGLVRTTDGGVNWVPVAGPMNANDTRFGVTGRGATVFVGDATGGVYRTTNGGDGLLSPSVLSNVAFTQLNANTANGCYAVAVCDSTYIPILVGYSMCDSAQIVGVQFLNDTGHELRYPAYANNTRFFSTAHLDTLHILYTPTRQESWTLDAKLTIRQPDGYLEDTIIHILLNGTLPLIDPLAFAQTSPKDSIDFGPVSLCSETDHAVTLLNTGCSDLTIQSMQTNGTAFSLVSSFKQFTLSPGTSRIFLLHYKPTAAQKETGSLVIKHSSGTDQINLAATGYAPNQTLSLQYDSVFSSLCDSAHFSIRLQNTACTPFKILSVTTNAPITLGPMPNIDSLRQGESTTLSFTFIPTSQVTVLDQIHISVSYQGSTSSYDTTITIVATGTSGKPDVVLYNTTLHPTTSLDLGFTSICNDAQDTLILNGTGCGDVAVSAALDNPNNGFSILRAPKGAITKGTFDTIIIRYHPGSTLGTQTTNLVLTTSAGTKTVACIVHVTSDPGKIALAVSPNIKTYTCQTTPFSFDIVNTTCNQISITGFVLAGANPQDFSISTTIPLPMPTGDKQTISGIFSPQDSLVRSATVTLTIERPDTTFDTTITISAAGIGVPPIKVALANAAYSAQTLGLVRIPVYAVTGSVVTLNSFDFGLQFNTDLLTPLRIVGGAGSFGNATATFTPTQDSLGVHLTFPADITLGKGELCEIECEAFVASKLSTSITLANPRFDNTENYSTCFSTQTVPDSVTTFTLSPQCADSNLTEYLLKGRLVLDRIYPNPTTGEVSLDFNVPDGYLGDGNLEVYDVLGNRLGEMPLALSTNASSGNHKVTILVDLGQFGSNSSEQQAGIRYLRVRTASGILTAKAMMWK